MTRFEARLLVVFAEAVSGIFSENDPEMIRLGAMCIRLQALALPIHGWVAVVNMFCAGLGNAGGAVLLSTSRQGSCFLPIAYPMAMLWGAAGVVSVQAVADVLSLAMAIPIVVYMTKKVKTAAQTHKNVSEPTEIACK